MKSINNAMLASITSADKQNDSRPIEEPLQQSAEAIHARLLAAEQNAELQENYEEDVTDNDDTLLDEMEDEEQLEEQIDDDELLAEMEEDSEEDSEEYEEDIAEYEEDPEEYEEDSEEYEEDAEPVVSTVSAPVRPPFSNPILPPMTSAPVEKESEYEGDEDDQDEDLLDSIDEEEDTDEDLLDSMDDEDDYEEEEQAVPSELVSKLVSSVVRPPVAQPVVSLAAATEDEEDTYDEDDELLDSMDDTEDEEEEQPIQAPLSTPVRPPMSTPVRPPMFNQQPVKQGEEPENDEFDDVLDTMDCEEEEEEQEPILQDAEGTSDIVSKISEKSDIAERIVQKLVNTPPISANRLGNSVPDMQSQVKEQKSDSIGEDKEHTTVTMPDSIFSDREQGLSDVEKENERLRRQLAELENEKLRQQVSQLQQKTETELENEKLRQQVSQLQQKTETELENEKLRQQISQLQQKTETEQPKKPYISVKPGLRPEIKQATVPTPAQPVAKDSEQDEKTADVKRWNEYAKLSTAMLWKRVEKFMSMALAHAAKTGKPQFVKPEVLYKEFGQRNIKKLEASYLIKTQKGYTY